MATMNKKDIATALTENIYENTTHDITATRVKDRFSNVLNSISVNITVAQLQAEDDSAEHSQANIIDPLKRGVFYYDSTDNVAADDGGGGCIVTANGKRYKRKVDRSIDARWYGKVNYYFDTIPDATTAVKPFTRFVGLEIVILLNGTPTTYWFSGGIADNNLITKSVETQVWEFTVGDGGTYTPADGSSEAINPDLASAQKIIGFWAGSNKIPVVVYPATKSVDYLYAQWRKDQNKIILKNGTDPGQFVADVDYSLIYK